MWIRELRVGGFGKLHNRVFDLEQGFNIIKGSNESGKSTLHAFIFAMLFGMERGRGKSARDDMYSRFKPWDNPGNYRGSMIFEHEGVDYRIDRVFLYSERQCTLTRLSDGKELPLPDGRITSLIPEITENAYRNTLFAMQEKSLETDELKGEVANVTAGTYFSGDASINVKAALMRLHAHKKEVAAGIDTDGEKELAEKLAECRERDKRITELEKEIKSLSDSREKISAELENDEELRNIVAHLTPTAKSGEENDDNHESTGVEPTKNTIRVTSRLSTIALILGLIIVLISNNRFQWGIVCGVLFIVAGVVLFIASYLLKHSSKEEVKADDVFPHLRSEYERLIAEKAALMKKSEQIKNEMEPILREYYVLNSYEETVESLEHEYRELVLANEAKRKELKSTEFAIETVEAVAEDIHNTFGKRLSDMVSELTDSFTCGAHHSIGVDDNYSLKVMDEVNVAGCDRLSAGTRRQIETALRLSVAEMFFSGKKLPLIFDEAFCYYDDERLKLALDTILERYDNQVILFTCHNREIDALGEAANVIELV